MDQYLITDSLKERKWPSTEKIKTGGSEISICKDVYFFSHNLNFEANSL